MSDQPDRLHAGFRLNLEQQKTRAKELCRAVKAGEGAAIARVQGRHPNPAEALSKRRLADCQLVIARELGLPSWPKLKAHIEQMERARAAISGPAPDAGRGTLHIRCGSDISRTLQDAGFIGDFLEYSDPFGQGPVTDAPDWLEQRARFLAGTYGEPGKFSFDEFLTKLQRAEERLASAARDFERVVLWTEHDSYDQLALIRWLAQFAQSGAPRVLELVSVNHFPGSTRFIGLGQLPPEAIRMLWSERRPVTPDQLALGASAFDALRRPDPRPLAAIALSGTPAMPNLAPALHRHLRELPSAQNGLSLTEQLTLEILADESRSIGRVFHSLMSEREPLPWLGDLMFLHVVESMARAGEPVFETDPATAAEPWPRRILSISETGRAVLRGERDWLSLRPPPRFVGGVEIRPGAAVWRWDETRRRAVLQCAIGVPPIRQML
jgi:hypothetical protein